MTSGTRHLTDQFVGVTTYGMHFDQASAVQVAWKADGARHIRTGHLIRTSRWAHPSDVIGQDGQNTDHESFTTKNKAVKLRTRVSLTPPMPGV